MSVTCKCAILKDIVQTKIDVIKIPACSNILKFTEASSGSVEAVRCSVKKLFLEVSQNSQENIFVGVSFLINLQNPSGGWFWKLQAAIASIFTINKIKILISHCYV